MLTVRSIDFESQKRETTLRTVSFMKINLNQTGKSDSLDEMIIEEPITSTNRKIGELKLQTTVSFKNLILHGENNGVKENGYTSIEESIPTAISLSTMPESELVAAAIKLQKVYKSYRTRRNLADGAVVVEELWWKALDFAALRQSSVSFFESDKSQTAVSRWARARTRAAKLGKGLSQCEKAQKLALRHWLEAIDPRHRYGHNLHLYYDVWFASESPQPFFYWLDIGEGKEVNLEKCSRTDLQHQCITYLGPKERKAYEVFVESGKLVYRQSGLLVDTPEGTKWIFVLSTTRCMYVGEKKKGLFQHSSFVAGGAIITAGRLVVNNGVLQAIWSYSGHYRPTEENFTEVINLLEEQQMDLTNVKKFPTDDDVPRKNNEKKSKLRRDSLRDTPSYEATNENKDTGDDCIAKDHKDTGDDCIAKDHDEDTQKAIEISLEAPKLELGKSFSCKWTTGAGPRIGCLREYTTELQFQALEQVNLSPRIRLGPNSAGIGNAPIPSPRPSPKFHLSPRVACMGLPSPRVPTTKC
ncbi:hypothetical protein FNV43_RR06675 [Rhamnella rubrinervis]|uniref:IQ domain-containing protein IQM1 n=1 Tax=Rhamnella rubrinervis TaxID=2594499 RepID=A0A8K0HDF9_9ROSA|nr:hypothetical protein FNV43_RR06675 [Rhamnella rubrinervis]